MTTFKEVTKLAGVWDAAAEAAGETKSAVQRPCSPTRDFPFGGIWSCTECHCLNLRHRLFCKRKGCGARRPTLQAWTDGDWYCYDCGNHNFHWRTQCAWNGCPTNNWECPHCGNENYADRKVCNRNSCRHPRPARR